MAGGGAHGWWRGTWLVAGHMAGGRAYAWWRGACLMAGRMPGGGHRADGGAHAWWRGVRCNMVMPRPTTCQRAKSPDYINPSSCFRSCSHLVQSPLQIIQGTLSISSCNFSDTSGEMISGVPAPEPRVINLLLRS